MAKKTALLLLLLTVITGFSRAADINRDVQDAIGNDIFINAAKENITFLPAPKGVETSSVYWQKKLCEVTINRPAKEVIEIKITPKKQNAFVQKTLRIPRTICKVRFYTPQGRNIYVNADTGNITMRGVSAKAAKLYTAQGITEITDYDGNLSAETLTSRITLKNIKGEDLKLKTASGNIYAGGLIIKDADVLNTSGKSRLEGIMQSLVFYSSEGPLYAKWTALPGNKSLNISARSFAGNIQIVMPRGSDIKACMQNIELKSIYGKAELENN